MKMDPLELLEQQAWRKQKMKWKADPESALEVKTSNGQWVVELHWFPAHRSDGTFILHH